MAMLATALFGVLMLRSAGPYVPAFVPNAQTINIRDYGAIGDGRHDDSDALRNALAASHDGSTIYIPAGTYIVDPGSHPFLLEKGISMIGAGAGSVLLVKNNVGDYEFLLTRRPRSPIVDSFIFRDFTIDQNITNDPTAHTQPCKTCAS